MNRKPHLYLSGPMSDMPQHNFPAFFMAAARLRVLGYKVTNPAELDTGECREWHEFMRRDLPALMLCEAICMLPGWHRSKGACLEHHNAVELGMPVYTIDQLLAERAAPQAEQLHNGAGEPDLWVSEAEIARLAVEAPANGGFHLRTSDGMQFLRGDRKGNRWAFSAVKRWRVAQRGRPAPRADALLTHEEHHQLHLQQQPQQTITIRSTPLGVVLCGFEPANDWAFRALETLRAQKGQVAA